MEEFAIFLYIKAVPRIEKNWGYDLATVLNSTFCYKLHSMNSDFEPPAFSMTRCRLQRYNKKFEITKDFPNIIKPRQNSVDIKIEVHKEIGPETMCRYSEAY